MTWRYLPHQLNNRKFDKAVVFVHGLDGSVKSWMGAPNRFVDRLSRVPAIYNHIGLYVFGYDTNLLEFGPVEKLLALIPGANEIAQKVKFNADIKGIAMELKASLSELLIGYKTIVLIGHEFGGLVIKRALVEMDVEELKRIRFFLSLAAPPTGEAPPSIPERTFSDFIGKLTDRFARISDPPESYSIETDDPHDSVLEINDPDSHLAYNKVLTLLQSSELNYTR